MSLLDNIVTKKMTLLIDKNVKILTYLSDCYQTSSILEYLMLRLFLEMIKWES